MTANFSFVLVLLSAAFVDIKLLAAEICLTECGDKKCPQPEFCLEKRTFSNGTNNNSYICHQKQNAKTALSKFFRASFRSYGTYQIGHIIYSECTGTIENERSLEMKKIHARRVLDWAMNCDWPVQKPLDQKLRCANGNTANSCSLKYSISSGKRPRISFETNKLCKDTSICFLGTNNYFRWSCRTGNICDEKILAQLQNLSASPNKKTCPTHPTESACRSRATGTFSSTAKATIQYDNQTYTFDKINVKQETENAIGLKVGLAIAGVVVAILIVVVIAFLLTRMIRAKKAGTQSKGPVEKDIATNQNIVPSDSPSHSTNRLSQTDTDSASTIKESESDEKSLKHPKSTTAEKKLAQSTTYKLPQTITTSENWSITKAPSIYMETYQSLTSPLTLESKSQTAIGHSTASKKISRTKANSVLTDFTV